MDWSKQIIRYIIVMALQVLLFDQLQLWGACHPYVCSDAHRSGSRNSDGYLL